MQKKKLIIIGSSILVVLITFLILLFTLFGLKLDKVSLVMHNDYAPFMQESFTQTVVENSGLKQNSSVFFINKTQIVEQIEKNNPYIEVINLETTFPNGLNIHIAKREEVFAIAAGNGQAYYIIDKDLKVLNIEQTALYESTNQNAILLEGVAVANSNATLGDVLQLEENASLVKTLARAFLANNRSAVEQKALFKNINIKTNQIREYLTNDDNTFIEIYLQDNYQIILYSPNTFLTQKAQLMFAVMPDIYPSYQTGFFMEIFEKLDSSLFSKFSLKN